MTENCSQNTLQYYQDQSIHIDPGTYAYAQGVSQIHHYIT